MTQRTSFRLQAIGLSILALLVIGWRLQSLRVRSAPRELVLTTTTSVRDTGLLDVLLPPFEKQRGMKVKVIAVGTGQALAIARRGDADVVLVHAPELEAEFVREGFGVERNVLMWNTFAILGPPEDPAGIKTSPSAAQAFRRIASAQATFVSRGDESGTHMREKELWQQAGIDPGGAWYVEAGSGMASTIRLANEKGAYVLSDRSTYLAEKKHLQLGAIYQGDEALLNVYSVMAVNPDKLGRVEHRGAQEFIHYLFSDDARRLIASFGMTAHGEPLFHLYPEEKGVPK